jgi:hypothetical protein
MSRSFQCFYCGNKVTFASLIPTDQLPERILGCSACMAHQVKPEDDTIIRLRQASSSVTLALGLIRLKRSAIEVLIDANQPAVELLMRHVAGDHGDVTGNGNAPCQCGHDYDTIMVAARDRFMSNYRTAAGNSLWIVTENWLDGTVTTVGVRRKES